MFYLLDPDPNEAQLGPRIIIYADPNEAQLGPRIIIYADPPHFLNWGALGNSLFKLDLCSPNDVSEAAGVKTPRNQ